MKRYRLLIRCEYCNGKVGYDENEDFKAKNDKEASKKAFAILKEVRKDYEQYKTRIRFIGLLRILRIVKGA